MLARVQALLGIVPLGLFLFVHAAEQWPALNGREAWLGRANEGLASSSMIAFVLLPLALHAVLGAQRLRGQAKLSATAAGHAAGRSFQAITGALLLVFVAVHVSQVWPRVKGPEHSLRAVYATLWDALGRPLVLAIYLLGVTAACAHFAHGLPRALRTFVPALSSRAELAERYVAFALGLGLWLAFLQMLAHFALGQGLLPSSE